MTNNATKRLLHNTDTFITTLGFWLGILQSARGRPKLRSSVVLYHVFVGLTGELEGCSNTGCYDTCRGGWSRPARTENARGTPLWANVALVAARGQRIELSTQSSSSRLRAPQRVDAREAPH